MKLVDTKYVRGADKLGQRIATIRRNCNLPVLTDEIAQLLLKRTLARFDAQVDPDNRPWARLAPYTLARRRAEGYPELPALNRSGKLRGAIQIIRGGLAKGAMYTNTGAGSRIGITDPAVNQYAQSQNRGSAHIPARRFLGVGRLDIKAVDSLLRRKAAKLSQELSRP